jgi:hypothetical protein
MPDDIDIAQEREQITTAMSIARISKIARAIDPGAPGDCELCGEWSGRIVTGACAPCREKCGLP